MALPPATVCLLALLVAGCGKANTPVAPKSAVQDAVSGIATACGEAQTVLAGRSSASALRRLDARALPYARRLVALERRDPQAIYLASDMSSLLTTERTAAHNCGLRRTARRLG
jgi:hypothetical protein